jgi:hypothetical protein
VADSCEQGNEISGSMRGGEFLDHLSYYRLLKRDLHRGAGLLPLVIAHQMFTRMVARSKARNLESLQHRDCT